MNGDMFCFIYKGGLVKVDDGTIQYIGGRTFSLEIDEHMSYDDFRSRVCTLLNMRPELVNLNSQSNLINLLLLCYVTMPLTQACSDRMMCIVKFMYFQFNVYLLTSSNLNLSNHMLTFEVKHSSHAVCLLTQLFVLVNCNVITPIVESNSPHVRPLPVATSSSIDRALRNTSRIKHRCVESHPNELQTMCFSNVILGSGIFFRNAFEFHDVVYLISLVESFCNTSSR